MAREKERNLAMVSFDRLRLLLKMRDIKQEQFAEEIDISYNVFRAILCGYYVPDTGLLIKMCMRLQCSANDIMELRGFEVKDRYKEHRTEFYPPVYGTLTYEPLRRLFRGNYGKDWKKKLLEMYDNVPVELSKSRLEASRAAVKKMNPKSEKPAEVKGLRVTARTKLNNDEPVKLSVLWGICSVLHCTPDYVIDYI